MFSYSSLGFLLDKIFIFKTYTLLTSTEMLLAVYLYIVPVLNLEYVKACVFLSIINQHSDKTNIC